MPRVRAAWVIALATACSPSKGPRPGPPSPGGSAATVSSSAPEDAEPLGRCDRWAFGPCSDGAQLHDVCRTNGVAVEAPKVPAYLACLETTLPTAVVKAGGPCEDAARRCGKATAACDVLSRKAAACRTNVKAQCLAAAETCWKLCLEKGPKPQHACAKKCGEYEGGNEPCVAYESGQQCQSHVDAAAKCRTDAQGTCKAAIDCHESLGGPCSAALEAVEACRARAKSP